MKIIERVYYLLFIALFLFIGLRIPIATYDHFQKNQQRRQQRAVAIAREWLSTTSSGGVGGNSFQQFMNRQSFGDVIERYEIRGSRWTQLREELFQLGILNDKGLVETAPYPAAAQYLKKNIDAEKSIR